MLILTRKPGESVYIGDNVKVTVVEIKGSQIRLGIDAPQDVRIYREEIYLAILEENRQAAEASSVTDTGLEGLVHAWQGDSGSQGDAGEAGSGKPKVTGLSSLSFKKGKGSVPSVVIRRKKKD